VAGTEPGAGNPSDSGTAEPASVGGGLEAAGPSTKLQAAAENISSSQGSNRKRPLLKPLGWFITRAFPLVTLRAEVCNYPAILICRG
jgi:hypothetical protein